MGSYVYIGHDGPRGSELRKTVRDEHIAELEVLDQAGRILFAGPLRDKQGSPAGSVVVIEAKDLAEATAIANADPYTAKGVFERVDVFETLQVFPKLRSDKP